MEVAKYLIDEAKLLLQRDGAARLPQRLCGTAFFVARADDGTVLAHGVVLFEGAEYKLGPIANPRSFAPY